MCLASTYKDNFQNTENKKKMIFDKPFQLWDLFL